METTMKKSFRDLRIENGYTQEELAKAWGISIRSLQYWEHGEIKNTSKILKLGIAHFFDEDLENLDFA